MDATFIYTQTVKNSKELTDALLAYNANMMTAKFCRNIVLKGIGAMDMPSIDEAMRMYQIRSKLDGLDPTAEAYPTFKMSNWGFGSVSGVNLFSALEYSSNFAWYVGSDGCVGTTSKYNQYGCVASLEIPA